MDEHLFQQRPISANTTGIEVITGNNDPNGNYVHIGNVTSDINGNYALPFTPNIPGQYQIIAKFAGSNSYGPSSATAYMAVHESSATSAPTINALSADAITSTIMMYTLIAAIAIIITIAIVGALLMLMFRKRPK